MKGLSRRSLFYGGAAIAASAGLKSSLVWSADAAKASTATGGKEEIFLGANEYPDGPGEAARRAVAAIIPKGGRYLDSLTVDLVKLFAGKLGVAPDHVAAYAGSFTPLNWTSLAFTSPTAGLVAADPTFTVGVRRAQLINSPVHLLPLRSDYTHDTEALTRVAHEKKGGLIYICNPNNPTGTVTPRADIEAVIRNKPKDTVVVVDEAYIDFTDARSVVDLVASGADVLVLRSFSKIHGLAGLRLGFAIARPDLLARLNRFGFSPLPVTAVTAGIASLEDSALVPTRKAATARSRADLVAWLKNKGYTTSPSDASFFLIDVKRPGGDFVTAFKSRGIHVGRVWQPYANAFRLTLGTPAELAVFKQAFTSIEQELKSVPVQSAQLLGEDHSEWGHVC